MKSSKKSSRVLACCVLLALGSAHAQSNYSTQPLNQALSVFSKQTGLQVIYISDDAAGQTANPVPDGLGPKEALTRMLEGTGLAYEFINERTVRVYAVQLQTTSTSSSGISSIAEGRNGRAVGAALMRIAAAEAGTSPFASNATDSGFEAASNDRHLGIEEVTVTGTHIRGGQNLSSPVIRFEREEIERGGYATTQQLIQSLPQSLNDISDMNAGSYAGGTGWPAYQGSGVNLRGLGADATLVLLNGRRLASAGDGSFVDLSLIPLGAIERMEVLTDGASALYGSDAVGGVVNLLLRKDFEGAETRLRYGTVTEGSHDEWQAGQTVGYSWKSGQALVSYDYLERSELDSTERRFFDPTISPYFASFRLVPELKRHGALAVLSQRLTQRMTVSAELMFGQRDSLAGYTLGNAPFDSFNDVTQYGGSVGLNIDVSKDWQVRLTGLFDRNDAHYRDIDQMSGAETWIAHDDSRLWSADLAADGSVFKISGGDVRLAVGAQVRHQELAEVTTFDSLRLERDVTAAYAEFLVPLVSDQNRRAGLKRLELTLAGRYEDYSDFGSTFNPKIGLAWTPLRGLNMRGTWGTSFKAPRLVQMSPELGFLVFDGFYMDETGAATALSLTGNAGGLGAEESKNWAVGFDLKPESLDNFSLSATYFDIDYDDRISVPLPGGYDPYSVLLDPTYSEIVHRNFTSAYVRELLASATTTGCYSLSGPCEVAQYLDQLDAIVDQRLRNLSSVRTTGVDLTATYRLASAIGFWDVNLMGSKLLNNRQRLVPSAPETSELDIVYRPVDLRLRGSLSFTREALSVTAAINYMDDYRDTRSAYFVGTSVQRSRVASWTTVDLTVQYDLNRVWGQSWLGNSTVQLRATNLFDRDPPYVASKDGLHYDGVNANPIGRFISAQITARWGR